MTKVSFILFWIVCLLYSVFSYSLTDPNLVISSWAPYWQFQQWMWQTFFENHQLLSFTFGLLMLGLVLIYIWTLSLLTKTQPAVRSLMLAWTAAAGVLFFSYNALSHDVFNYMFNAKMVMVYDANPHLQVALNFPQDEWLRFMHNTHTPAPYAEGWTALSLFPYLLGGGTFVLTWFNFKLLSLLSFGSILYLAWRTNHLANTKTKFWLLAALAFNPLLLIEIISNAHNDLWMMLPAIGSLLLAGTKLPAQKTDQAAKLLLSLLLLGLSISVKWASLVIIPLWLILWLLQCQPQLTKAKPYLKFVLDFWPVMASMLMFLPLLTGRSQLFHPWYLAWSIVWLPFFNWKSTLAQAWGLLLLSFSISSLFRYLPWLWAGNFEGEVLFHQQLITWAGGLSLAHILYFFRKRFTLSK